MHLFSRIALLLFLAGALLIFIFACSSGELPTAIEPPRQLHAARVTEEKKPTLDGRADDFAWQQSSPYRVFLDAKTGGVNVASEGIMMTFQAAWWKEMKLDTVDLDSMKIDTTFVPYIGLLTTWPDPDKSIDKQMWTYDPTTALWKQSDQGADWMLILWPGAAEDTDLWYWDAATTNPMAYFQDMVLEDFSISTGLASLLSVQIDGLNFFNDTATRRNTWDRNYDDNKTPRDSTDDRPSFAWKQNPQVVEPSLPPVYSTPDERRHFLLETEAEKLDSTPLAKPSEAVNVPGFVLQQPAGGCADIRAAGRHENGRWTLEFVRKAKATDASDVVLSPEDRYFSRTFYLAIGNNVPSPFDSDVKFLNSLLRSILLNPIILTFEFVFEG